MITGHLVMISGMINDTHTANIEVYVNNM